MKPLTLPGTWAAVLLLGAALFTGCETTDSGSSAAGYYGTGFSDPWYYGGDYDDVDIIVTPPPPRPTHPIAAPPGFGPRPMPMPSIPARPMPRGR